MKPLIVALKLVVVVLLEVTLMVMLTVFVVIEQDVTEIIAVP